MGIKAFVRNKPATFYFTLTFLISWLGAFALVANKLIHGVVIPKLYGILMFPIMLLGPFVSGIVLTGIKGGKQALKDLATKLNPARVSKPWFLALLIPPASILFILTFLSITTSKIYAPNLFQLGFLFGIPAGLLEEIGWMGFAFPNMNQHRSAFSNSILLGLIWGLWHLPAINFLGTASPHGSYLFLYFLSFVMVMTAIRVIIAWVYNNTQSLFLCQLMHISSTGFLVMLSPSPITIQQEPIWYFAYSIVLWIIVFIIVYRYGKNLVRKKSKEALILEKL
jgi:membrane protease YdiL (CAAX protease family)